MEFRNVVRNLLAGTFSKAIMCSRTRIVFVKLKDFRKRFETFEVTTLECPAQVASRKPCGYRARRGAQGSVGNGIPIDPTGELLKGFRGDFRTLLEGTFSKTIISDMPEDILKLCNFRQCLGTYGVILAPMPRSDH